MSFERDEYKPHICIRHGYWRVMWKRWGFFVENAAHVPPEFRKSDSAIACHAFASRLNNARD